MDLNLFWQVTQRSIQRQLTYRGAIFAGLFTNFFFGLFRAAILLALLGQNESVAGYNAQGLITYTALTQAVIGFLSLFGWFDLMTAVYTGEISSDLLKPMRLFTFWMAQDCGRSLVNLLLRGVLFMFLFELVYDLAYPKTAVQWAALSISLIFSWLISFTWRFALNLAAFWTPQAKGIIGLGYISSWFFSGFLMPVGLFPEWVQRVAYLTPFPYLLDAPVEIYLGISLGSAVLNTILMQLLWLILLIGLTQLILSRGIKRLVILGG